MHGVNECETLPLSPAAWHNNRISHEAERTSEVSVFDVSLCPQL